MNKLCHYLCCCWCCDNVSKNRITKRQNLHTLEGLRQTKVDSLFLIETDPLNVPTEKMTKLYEVPNQFADENQVFENLGYKLDKYIDQGSFGKVFKAIHIEKQLVVAVKKIQIPGAETQKQKEYRAEMMRDVKNELFTLEKINHAHVIKMICHLMIKEWPSQTRTLYIVMQFASGGTLSKYCENFAPLSEDKCRLFFAQILSALKALKEYGIAHRDLKQSNILLDEVKDVLVSDFGASRLVWRNKDNQDIIESTTYCGTPPYMAPEILKLRKQKKSPDKKNTYNAFQSDVWSLGVVLYKMFENCYPFSRKLAKALRQMRRKTIKFPNQKPSPQLEDVFEKIFVMDPDDRITIENLIELDWVKGIYSEVMENSIVKLYQNQNLEIYNNKDVDQSKKLPTK